LRRAFLLFALGAALTAAVPASAQLVPVQRSFDGRTLPRLRAGTIPLQHAGPARVRVIAQLPLAPLATRYGRGLQAVGGRRKLAVHSRAAQAYVARLASAQATAVAQLHATIPQARVQQRFRILLDAVTVDLPNRDLPELMRLREFTRIYPSLHYTLADDTSAGVIGADVLQQQRGADGAGMKIGIIDDGIDQTNAFFDPSGFSYPAGFPKGDAKYTTPKVIVARAFPGPGSGKAGRLPVDPKTSFHGTHVAGIAAGDAGTTAPAGADHPKTTGLTGVAPRAWLGNYRVITVPTPVGVVGDTPEIIQALESAVADGMDVVNLSLGGPQTEPANDALVPAIDNVAAAGVVPVIAAGNDRDDFGNGSTGSPATAPDGIAVAAVSNSHVFAPALDVTTPGAPATVTGIPFLGAGGSTAPASWATTDQMLVDVGTIVGTDGKPVDRLLCGPAGNLASTKGTLPAGSLDGAIALVKRGICPFVTKAEQAKAAGAIGIVYSDNRQGEQGPAEGIPIRLGLPGGMIANLDGDHLRAFMASSGGRTQIRIGHTPLELDTGRSGVITSFSSAGPTAFGHDVKPDISAPGGQILSSTLPNTDKSRFAVFDGTSMATPHVAGAAALLLQLHPGWSPDQVKSALMSAATPAWGDTARTQEASVPLEGAGLVSLPGSADPRILTAPASLSFEDLDITHGAASKALLVRVTDAGSGSGTWQVSVAAQAATAGVSVDPGGLLVVPPGGESVLSVEVRASADATPGQNYGFVVLRQGSITRRIPYFVLVDKPALASAPIHPLKAFVEGTTKTGVDRVDAYGFPLAPFKNAPDEPPMIEDGAETVYRLLLNGPAANAGVSIVAESPDARIDPWFLGAPDEWSVQGFAGTPVDVNDLTYDYLFPISAAGASFPRVQAFYVSVDSGRDQFTNRRLAGRYLLRSWVNDVSPPFLSVLTRRVSSGRPTIVIQTLDLQSGVDPLSLAIGYKSDVIGASDYDPLTGLATFPLPRAAAALKPGKLRLAVLSSDFEEAKNINTTGASIMPNTSVAVIRLKVVRGPAVTWLQPARFDCIAKSQQLLVAASATSGVKSVRFLLDGHAVAKGRRTVDGIWAAKLSAGHEGKGRHKLEARVTDRHGHTATDQVSLRRCR
jgi:minor extracellular serine protease Vpr